MWTSDVDHVTIIETRIASLTIVRMLSVCQNVHIESFVISPPPEELGGNFTFFKYTNHHRGPGHAYKMLAIEWPEYLSKCSS